MKNSIKVGLALGSGGARGLAHLGVIKVLQEAGIPISMVAGSSIGAIIGAYYALTLDITPLYKLALSLKRSDLIKLIDITPPKKAIIKGKKIEDFIYQLVGDASFSKTKIPLFITATDLCSGKEVIFTKGKIIDAIRASISIPGIFPPAEIKGKYYIDGGVLDPTPTSVLLNKGLDLIIAVDLTMKSNVDIDESNINIVTTLLRSFEILRTRITELSMQIDRHQSRVVVIRPTASNVLDTYKFYKKSFIYDGEREMRKYLPTIREMLKHQEK